MNPRRPRLAGQCQSRHQVLGFPQVSRSLLGGAGDPGIPAARGRAHLPTSHLGGGGGGGGGRQSELLWPPGSAGGSPPKAAVPRDRGRPSGGTRGVGEPGMDPGSPPPRLASRSPPSSQSGSPPNRKKPISSSSSNAAAPSARGRPRSSMTAGRGPHGGARPRAVGSIAGPVDQGGRGEVSPGRRGPTATRSSLPPLSRHLTCSRGVGSPTLLSQKLAGVQGNGRWRVGQPRPSRSQPRPQPGFRFHLRLAESEGAGRPPHQGEEEGRAALPPLPGAPTPGKEMREPSGWPEGSGAATREGPVQNYLL